MDGTDLAKIVMNPVRMRIDRFKEIVHGSVLKSASYIIKIIISTEHNKLDGMKFFAQSMNQADTIHAVHFDISKYNLRFVCMANFKGIFPAQAGSDLAGFREIKQANLVMQALADIIFVIDNQDIVHSS